MKKIFFLLMLSCFSLQAQNTEYDEALAKKLGADEYGMKQYVFAILKTGSATIDDKAKVNFCGAHG